MGKKCLKCGHETPLAGSVDPPQCASCGAYFAKVEVARAASESKHHQARDQWFVRFVALFGSMLTVIGLGFWKYDPYHLFEMPVPPYTPIAARRQASTVDAEATDQKNPLNLFPQGAIFDNNKMVAIIDHEFPDATWYPDQTTAIPYRGVTYIVKTRKVNDTDIPARYQIVSVTTSDVRPDPPPQRSVPAETRVSCGDLYEYAKIRGLDFFERAALVSDAQRNRLCVR